MSQMSTMVIDLQQAEIWQQNDKILDDVIFQLAQAEICYIIGKSGSGKTSLLKTIYGSLPLKKGLGIVNNFELHHIKRHQIPFLRRTIGMIFQDFQLFEEWTVRKNLSFVLQATGWKDKNSMTERINDVVSMTGIENLQRKKVENLSGGEQQKVSIARSLLNNPTIIIADEPTGNLDPDTSDEILYLLNRLNKEHGTSILIATHDYRLIQKFPARVVRCENGKLFEV